MTNALHRTGTSHNNSIYPNSLRKSSKGTGTDGEFSSPIQALRTSSWVDYHRKTILPSFLPLKHQCNKTSSEPLKSQKSSWEQSKTLYQVYLQPSGCIFGATWTYIHQVKNPHITVTYTVI